MSFSKRAHRISIFFGYGSYKSLECLEGWIRNGFFRWNSNLSKNSVSKPLESTVSLQVTRFLVPEKIHVSLKLRSMRLVKTSKIRTNFAKIGKNLHRIHVFARLLVKIRISQVFIWTQFKTAYLQGPRTKRLHITRLCCKYI